MHQSPCNDPPRQTSPSAIAFEDDIDSESEKCGFVCHVLVVLISVTYTVWMVLRSCDLASDPQAVEASAAWTTVLSMVAVCFFFAAPVVYGAINALLATPSRIDAVETIQDGYTVKPPRNINKDYSYFRNPMESCSDSSCLPEICDMDVADINDLLARSCNVR